MRGRTATVEEIAQELALTPEAVRELLMTVPRSVSLEIKVGKEKDTELLDLLEIEAVSSENHFVYESLQRDAMVFSMVNPILWLISVALWNYPGKGYDKLS